MRATIFLIAIGLTLSGCISIKDVDPISMYSDIKEVYKDAKHVLYEIDQEKDRIDADGLGEK